MKDAVTFDLAEAVRRNRFWAGTRRKVKYGPRRLVWQGQGWAPLYGAISAWLFGAYDPPPPPDEFARLVAHWQRAQGDLAVNGVLSGTPWRRMRQVAARGIPAEYASPVTGMPRPHGWADAISTFGDPRALSQSEWESYYIGLARAPGTRRFTLADGRQVPAIPLHRALVPHAEAFFAAVARGGLWDELQPVGRAYEWDPAGESIHAWGLALDLRPDQYLPVRRLRDIPGAEHYPPGYLLRHIQSWGWHWGLWFEVPHPGHLQFATGIETCAARPPEEIRVIRVNP